MGLKFFLTVTMVVTVSLAAFSQFNYRSGYIIDNNGDTIHGLIKSLDLITISEKCWFMKSAGDEPVCFSPKDIKAFRFMNGKYYVSEFVNIDKKAKQVFLEYLINGKAGLYYLKDLHNDHYYIQNENDSIYELLNSSYQVYPDYPHYIAWKNEYIGLLKYIFRDCQDIHSDIDQLKLDHKSLTDITLKYHNIVCSDRACIVYEKDARLKTSVGATMGIYQTNINFIPINSLYKFIKEENFQQVINYSPGVMVSFSNLFGFNENFEFTAILGYNDIQFKSENIKIYQQRLNIPIYVTYYIPTKTIRPFVNFGVNNLFGFNTSITNTSTYVTNQRDTEQLNRAFGNYQIGGLVGLGCEVRSNKVRYFGNFQYIYHPYGISKLGSISNYYMNSHVNNLGIMMGVKFDIN